MQLENKEFKELPYNLELEKSVLGALMVTPVALTQIDKISVHLFYYGSHQIIFSAILSLFENSKAVDVLTVIEKLRNEGVLEDAGGELYVTDLAMRVVSSAHLEAHIASLQELYIRRQAITVATDLLQGASNGTTDAIDLLENSSRALEDILGSISASKDVSMERAVCETIDYFELCRAKGGISGLSSGLVELDRMTSGFQPGTLTILDAQSSSDSTSLALSLVRSMTMKTHVPVAFFSLEAPKTKLVSMLVADEMGVSLSDLGARVSQDWINISSCLDKLQKLPLYIDDIQDITPLQLQARGLNLRLRHNIGALFVDGLHRLRVPVGSQNEQEHKMAIIARQLKRMSQILDVPVIATAPLEAVDGIGLQPYQLSFDSFDPGVMVPDADIILSLRRLMNEAEKLGEGETPANKASLYIIKNNLGPTGLVKLNYNPKSTLFTD